VLVRSSNHNLNLSQVTAFPPRAETSRGFSLDRRQFLIATRRGISSSHDRTGATRHGEIREPCPARPPFPAAFAGSQAHQLHPAVLRFDPELSRGFPPAFPACAASAFVPPFSAETDPGFTKALPGHFRAS